MIELGWSAAPFCVCSSPHLRVSALVPPRVQQDPLRLRQQLPPPRLGQPPRPQLVLPPTHQSEPERPTSQPAAKISSLEIMQDANL
jgi:hypothetical protein